MKRFLLSHVRVLGVLCTLFFVSQITARADAKKIPIVTRDNFVSLKFTAEDDTRIASNLVIAGNTISRTKNHVVGISPTSPSTAPLSNNQLAGLLNAFNRAELSGVEGEPMAVTLPSTMVRPRQTMTVVISDERNRDRFFTISQFGTSDFEELAANLRQLSADKFADSNPSDKITRQNFKSVQLETFGGFAGMKSSILVAWSQTSANATKPKLTWNEAIGSRKAGRVIFLSDADFNHLISMMNAAKISQLNGRKFEQVGLYDGFHETLTVTLKNDRKFIVENYGDTAPAEYYAITRQIQALKSSTTSSK